MHRRELLQTAVRLRNASLKLNIRHRPPRDRSNGGDPEQRLALRQRAPARLAGKLHQYLLELQAEVLPKSPSGAAVRYALNQCEALTRFLKDGELEIDNGATERTNREGFEYSRRWI